MATPRSFLLLELDGITPKTDAAPTFTGGIYRTRALADRTPPVITHLGGGKYGFTPSNEDEGLGVAYLTADIPNAVPSRAAGAVHLPLAPFAAVAFYDVNGVLWAGALPTVGQYRDPAGNVESAPSLVAIATPYLFALTPTAADLAEGRAYRVDAPGDCFPAFYDGDFFTGLDLTPPTAAGSALRAVLAADATVTALVAGRIFPNLMPQGTVLPAIVYQVVSDVPENAFTGDSTDRLVGSRVQFDSYSKSYLEAHAVAAAVDAVLSALATPDLSAWRESSRDLYDDEAQLHRVSADYSAFR